MRTEPSSALINDRMHPWHKSPNRWLWIPRRIVRALRWVGVDLMAGPRNAREIGWYLRDLSTFASLQGEAAGHFPIRTLLPCLHDKRKFGGSATGQYFHQDLLVAQRIFAAKPLKHVDVGSRVDGFAAHVAAYRALEVLDIRPTRASVRNLSFRRVDFMEPLPDDLIGYCDSVSCLHALEHFGLGRYGDTLNVDGFIVGLRNIERLLVSGGTLYLSVPIGPQRIEFNAHRIFSVAYLMTLLGAFEISSISIVDDDSTLQENVALDAAGLSSNFGCQMGLAIVEARKR